MFDYKKYLNHRISQNALANFIRSFLQILIAFIGNYFIVRIISKEEIGLWALVFAFVTFLNLVDMGVSQALIRYVANDEKNLKKYFWTTMQFYSVVGLLGGVLLLAVGQIFAKNIFSSNIPGLNFLLITILGTYLSLLGTVFTNTFNGLQLMKKSAFIEVIKSLSHYILVLCFYKKVGILAFSLGILGSGILACLLGFILLRRKIDISFEKFDKSIFSKMWKFGLKIFGVQIINQIKGAWLPFMVSSYFGIVWVAYTDYVTRIIGYFRQLLLSLILPILPAAAAIQAKKETDKLRKLYTVSLWILMGFGLIVSIGFVVLIPYFIRFWLGAGYEPVILASQIICWAVLFNLLTGPGVYILQGINKQKPILLLSFTSMVLFLVFTLAGARVGGYNAIFIGNVLAEVIVGIVFLWWCRKNIRNNQKLF